MTKSQVSVLLATALVLATSALGESVFEISVQKAGEGVAAGLGALVGDGLILSSESLVAQGDQSFVHDSASGATILAEIRAQDPEADLALLRVPSLAGEALAIAMEAPEAGRHVYLRVLEGVRRDGVFHSVIEDAEARPLYRYTSVSEPNEAGAPLMNNCDELLAISQPSPVAEPDAPGSQFGFSGSLPDLAEFLRTNEIEFRVVAAVCPSLRDQLSQASDSGRQLAEEKAALEQEVEELEESLDQSTRLSKEKLDEVESNRAELESRLRRKSDELSEKVAELEEGARVQAELEERSRIHTEELRRRDEEFAEMRIQQEEAGRLRWIIGGGLGLIALLLGAIAWRKSKLRQAELQQASEELEAARISIERDSVTFSDVILVGDGPDNEEVRVKVNGTAVARAERGQVIGRSSAHADYVIAEGSVSRRHALLRVSAGQMTIEDLGSLNGTLVDGVKLEAGKSRKVADGTRIALGDVEVMARFLGE